MMALPFFTLFVALACGWKGWRVASLALWAVSMAMALVLFGLHATDSLDLAF